MLYSTILSINLTSLDELTEESTQSFGEQYHIIEAYSQGYNLFPVARQLTCNLCESYKTQFKMAKKPDLKSLEFCFRNMEDQLIELQGKSTICSQNW